MNNNSIRKFDIFYFIALGLLIVLLTGFVFYITNEHRKLLIIEEKEKTLLYLDDELCERVRFLEQHSLDFEQHHKISKDCNVYDKLNFKRIIADE